MKRFKEKGTWNKVDVEEAADMQQEEAQPDEVSDAL